MGIGFALVVPPDPSHFDAIQKVVAEAGYKAHQLGHVVSDANRTITMEPHKIVGKAGSFVAQWLENPCSFSSRWYSSLYPFTGSDSGKPIRSRTSPPAWIGLLWQSESKAISKLWRQSPTAPDLNKTGVSVTQSLRGCKNSVWKSQPPNTMWRFTNRQKIIWAWRLPNNSNLRCKKKRCRRIHIAPLRIRKSLFLPIRRTPIWKRRSFMQISVREKTMQN